jgi:hypothetical protein
MLDEGICVQHDVVAAAHYFARGASLGDRGAALDYATKVGLGEGTDQGYARAGQICRDAGVDAQARVTTYALGYACTLRGVASRMLRERLPLGAFRQNTGALLVEFNPASAAMSIRHASGRVGRGVDRNQHASPARGCAACDRGRLAERADRAAEA